MILITTTERLVSSFTTMTMDTDGKKQRQREANRRWRERNPEKVKEANRKKRDRVYDPAKRSVWRANRLAKNPEQREKENAQARARKDAINKFLRAHKLSVGCSECGYSEHPAALEFHHQGDKEINLSFAKRLTQAKKEMKKCVVLCPNCHRIRHWNERP